jgi:hypothetical protein
LGNVTKLNIQPEVRSITFISCEKDFIFRHPSCKKISGLRIRITHLWIRIQLFTQMQIRILLLIKVIKKISDHWSIDPPELHFEPQGFNADTVSDPDFHSNANPDPASHQSDGKSPTTGL